MFFVVDGNADIDAGEPLRAERASGTAVNCTPSCRGKGMAEMAVGVAAASVKRATNA